MAQIGPDDLGTVYPAPTARVIAKQLVRVARSAQPSIAEVIFEQTSIGTTDS